MKWNFRRLSGYELTGNEILKRLKMPVSPVSLIKFKLHLRKARSY